MKILMLSRFFWPHIGGVEKHVEKVGDELIKKGHTVTVLTLQHDPKLPLIETRRKIKILRIPYSNNKWRLWKNLWAKRSVIKQADIVHCHDIFFWYLPFRFIYPQKPVYITFHGWEGKFPIPQKNKLMRRLSEQLSWGNICVGDYLKKYYNTKPDYITYGGCEYQPSGRAPFINSKKLKEVVFIGRLEKDLGIEMYLPVFQQIKKKHGFKITFVGDGSYRQQAEKIGRVTGFVKNISPYLQKPAFIFASSYLTILEAMVNQRPVFALYHNQLKKDYLKLFPGAKFIHISGSAKELRRQFDQAVKQPKKIDQMIVQAYAFAKKQTWNKVVNQYLNLWNITSNDAIASLDVTV
jgi:glycosyltransferase involved in cell wall biosynthesis